MSSYPVVYRQTPAIERSRLTVFFRFIMVIPHLLWSFVYGIAAHVVVFIAWFVIVLTGRYPKAMYEFVAGYVRFYTRLLAYIWLVTDEFPPFDGAEHPEYPVTVTIPPPQESYSRLSTAFRIILLIPVWILQYVFLLWIHVVSGRHRSPLLLRTRSDSRASCPGAGLHDLPPPRLTGARAPNALPGKAAASAVRLTVGCARSRNSSDTTSGRTAG